MIKLEGQFKIYKGQGTTKRNDFVLRFGIFKIKELANTKNNREKARLRGSMFYLIDTQKQFNNNRVSSVYWASENVFYFDTDTPKNCNDYVRGYFKGIIKDNKVEVLEVSKSEFVQAKKEYASVLV